MITSIAAKERARLETRLRDLYGELPSDADALERLELIYDPVFSDETDVIALTKSTPSR